MIRLSLSTEEGLTLKLLAPLKINLLKLKLLCEDNYMLRVYMSDIGSLLC